MTALQYGQPRRFMFKLKRSGSASLCVRALAIVHGSSTVALTCVEPQPSLLLLTEQRALATYLQAIGKLCHFYLSKNIYVPFPLECWFNRKVDIYRKTQLVAHTRNGAPNAILF